MGFTDGLQWSLPVVASSLVCLYGFYWTVTTYNQYGKLRHIKGPWLASVSPLWMFYHSCKGTLYLAVEDALQTYGMNVPSSSAR